MMVIRITGKARDVFGAIKKMAHDNPNKTLGDIIREGENGQRKIL